MFIRARYFRKGSVITEVLMTMLLIVITMVAIIPMFAVGVKTNKVAKSRTVEMQIVQTEIERFNQDKFTNVLNYLKAKNTVDNFAEFKNSTKSLPDDKFVYINPATGRFMSLPDPNSIIQPPSGYKVARIAKTYSYLKGTSSIMDDAIQLVVTVQISGINPSTGIREDSTGKPVAATSLISMDKLQN